MSVLPSLGAYEFWVVKRSLHFILNMSFMIQRKHFLKKERKELSSSIGFTPSSGGYSTNTCG